MNNRLTYDDLCNYYANKCNICNGSKRVVKNNVNTVCSCQLKATSKHRIDSIEVSPNFLKYKRWSDFTGLIGEQIVTGQLNIDSMSRSLSLALLYCFKTDNLNLIQNRKKYLTIHRHLNDGQNVIIAGDKKTGKTMLAILILKEIIYSSSINNIKIEFQWVKFVDFFHAARWSDNKSVDCSYFNRLSNIDFLFIDGIDKPDGGHNQAADIYTLDSFFDYRNIYSKPTIFICSRRFLTLSQSKVNQKIIIDYLGENFYSSFTKESNCVIKLKKEKMFNESK